MLRLVVLNGYGNSRLYIISLHLPGKERDRDRDKEAGISELLFNTPNKLLINPILVTCFL